MTRDARKTTATLIAIGNLRLRPGRRRLPRRSG